MQKFVRVLRVESSNCVHAPSRRRSVSVPKKKSLAAALDITLDPVEAAQEAGLRYVTDEQPGITRKKRGNKWAYFLPDGKRVTEHNEIVRINRLAIPPAYTDVWICPKPNGHLQATGRDARGRKQYRYHARWREVRDTNKYEKMIAFGAALPKIRKRVRADLALPDLPRNKVLAAIVRLLEMTLIRVGNEEYAKENKSYGLTTMKNRHVAVRGAAMKFKFRGKHGKEHEITMDDKRLAKIVKRCRDLPGQDLFAYVDGEGNPQSIGSSDVNDYLQEIAGEEFTAKDFRTWAGTKLAALALQEFDQFENPKEAKANVVKAVEAVSQLLGNTPAICRKCYVHPAVVEAYLDGKLAETLAQKAEKTISKSLALLKPDEAAVMVLLHGRLQEARK
ncbi:MAG: topoisomerase [Chthoniobacter sp.]|nr:topoisomerase [Chthoniobacter sp.]